jgi:hypothetical protein
MDHLPDNNDQEFHLQLQYAVSESLHSIQQQIQQANQLQSNQPNNQKSNFGNDGSMDQN